MEHRDPDLNEQGGFEAGWFMFQTPVVGNNYVGMIASATDKEGLSQNLSSVIASGTNINWSVYAASGQLNNNVRCNRYGHARNIWESVSKSNS